MNPNDQLVGFAKTDFDEDQMSQVEIGLNNGLTSGQVMLYSNSKYHLYQMEEIREEIIRQKRLEKEKTKVRHSKKKFRQLER